ncbi:S-layer homology domain-containing protein [Crassaminicella profunda]|uniref:S-layer homology domain-containing protein n=1 Tax=Crassaminicella profunda TaxID=1286698 RepID=UPI001CA6C101|nr:S-layer homology domain-containing protein [Crassaminicella profunda]QZY55772.1 S-layer homology domain-containing protein [Crassaminicella profunda]
MKKLLAIILIITLILPTTFIGYAEESVNYNEFSDIQGHWAEETIKKHHKIGMLSGYPDGTFKPDQEMKRSELITLVNKYFGLKEEGKQNFGDVLGEEWYAGETAKAKYYGYIKDLEARPEELATREDVVNMMSLIVDVEEQRKTNEKKDFKDLKEMDEETEKSIEKFSEMGYISGYKDGTFKPKGIINRAEIMTIVENVLGYIVTSQEDLENMPEDVKKITVINPNITIENKEINGDLYISPGANGKVIIKNTKIHGQIDVSGGTTKKPIQLEAVEVEKIVITKVKTEPKIEIKGKSEIGKIKTKASATIAVSGGSQIKEIDTQGKTTLDLDKGTKVEKLIIEKETKVHTKKGSKIINLEAKEQVEITGDGRIDRAEIKSKNVSIEKRPSYIKVNNGIDNTKIGNDKIDATNDDEEGNYQSNDHHNHGNSSHKDRTPPNWETGSPYAEMKSKELKIKIKTELDEKSTVYYIVQEENKTFTVEELIANGNHYDIEKNTVIEEVYDQGLTDEKNYEVHLVAVDEHNNKQKNVTVISVKKIDDKAPQWATGFPYAQMKSSELKINIFSKLNEKSTVYYTVYEAVYDKNFTVDDLISIGNSYDVEKNTVAKEVYDGGVTLGKIYNIYVTAVDENENKQDSVKEIKVSEIDTTPPVFTEKEGDVVDKLGTIKFSAQTNEPSTIHYILVEDGSALPTVAQVKAKIDYKGVRVLTSGEGDGFTNQAMTEIPYGKSYEMYLVAEDTAGNITSEVAKISIENPIFTKIKGNWIPIANKTELKQIEVNADSIFGVGTPWEGTYTGGMDKKYMLVANMDLAGDNFVPIGYDEAEDTSVPFTGKFMGNGYEITHLNIQRDKELQGLFSKLGSGAWLSDIMIKEVTMKTGSKSGVLAGEANGAEILKSTISKVTFDLFENNPGEKKITKYIGGFIGKSTNTSFKEVKLNEFKMLVTGVWRSGEASHLQNIGGITGLLDGGDLEQIEVKNIHIESVSDYRKGKYYPIIRSGGLVGEIQNSQTKTLIVDQCNVSDLTLIICGGTGYDEAGGLVGKIDTTSTEIVTNGDIIVKNSMASGVIQGKGKFLGAARIGGFVGILNGTNAPSGYIIIENCSADVDVNELDIQSRSADVMSQGGTGGFAAILTKAKVCNSYATGTLDSPFLSGAGGFSCYIMEGSVIENCYATGDVLGYRSLGGFASVIENSQIDQCYTTGNIGENDNQGGTLIFAAGGFASMIDGSTLSNNYSLGKVKEANGGTGAGFSFSIQDSTLTNIYTCSKVLGNNNIFAYMTQNENMITNSYWNKSINPTGKVIFRNGSTGTTELEGKTDLELKEKATFINWDISDKSEGVETIWFIEEGKSYPYLRKE